jgi:hypothetical protein
LQEAPDLRRRLGVEALRTARTSFGLEKIGEGLRQILAARLS